MKVIGQILFNKNLCPTIFQESHRIYRSSLSLPLERVKTVQQKLDVYTDHFFKI